MDRFLGALPKIITIALVVLLFLQRWRAGYFKYLLTYAKQIAWKRVFWYAWLTALLIVVCLVYADPTLLSLLRTPDHDALQLVSDVGGALGRNIHPWMFLACLYLIGLVFRLKNFSDTAFSGIFAAALGGALSLVFKFAFLRARPFGNLGHLSFFNFEGLFKDARVFQSFTSGDVALVAAIAFFFFLRLKPFFFRWLLILLPLSTAIARVHANKHWPSDTLLAIGVGFFSAWFVFGYQKIRSQKDLA